MAFVEHSITLNVPISVVYRQWTEFESFPYFMHGVKYVERLSDIRFIWLGEIGDDEMEWYTEISQINPNQLIAWHSTSGPRHHVTVRFFYIDDDSTRLVFQLDYESAPQSTAAMEESIGQLVAGNLERFKAFIEDQKYEATLWRGEVERAVARLWNPRRPEL